MTSLSRPLVSTPSGKLTAVVPTFKIDEDTFDEASVLAKRAGMSLSEWVRTLVMVRVPFLKAVADMNILTPDQYEALFRAWAASAADDEIAAAVRRVAGINPMTSEEGRK